MAHNLQAHSPRKRKFPWSFSLRFRSLSLWIDPYGSKYYDVMKGDNVFSFKDSGGIPYLRASSPVCAWYACWTFTSQNGSRSLYPLTLSNMSPTSRSQIVHYVDGSVLTWKKLVILLLFFLLDFLTEVGDPTPPPVSISDGRVVDLTALPPGGSRSSLLNLDPSLAGELGSEFPPLLLVLTP